MESSFRKELSSFQDLLQGAMSMSSSTTPATDTMVFRKTNQHVGRHISVTPSNSTNQHLSYGRIILNASERSVRFTNDGQETGLVCLSGEATVKAGSQQFDIAQYDSIYIPRES